MPSVLTIKVVSRVPAYLHTPEMDSHAQVNVFNISQVKSSRYTFKSNTFSKFYG